MIVGFATVYCNAMTTYNEFRKVRRIQISMENPGYSPKTIQMMISDEWKQQTGSGSHITSRKTTLQYEIIRTLINRIPKFDVSKHPKVCEIVNRRSCSYCDKQLPRKSTGDHFMPVAANSKKPILSNFSHLTIPCCQQCNSSKGKKSWEEFIEMKNVSDDIIVRLRFLQNFINENIKHYSVDQQAYDDVLREIQDCLERLRQMAESIPFIEIIQE